VRKLAIAGALLAGISLAATQSEGIYVLIVILGGGDGKEPLSERPSKGDYPTFRACLEAKAAFEQAAKDAPEPFQEQCTFPL